MKTQISNLTKAHSYDLEVMVSNGNVGHAYEVIEVDANTRAEARKIAEFKGYIVRSVNMTG